MRSTILFATLFACGCHPTDPSGEAARPAWVMVEQAPAWDGWRVRHADWADAPRLPTEVDPDSPVLLRSPRGEETGLDLSPGFLARVRAGGAVEVFEPGVDVPMDRLVARGEERAIRELGNLLQAEVVAQGAAAFLLEGEGLFERTGFLEVPEGVDEIGLDLGETPALAAPTSISGYAVVGEHAERAAMLVGAYWAGANVVVLDAEGGFTWTEGCWGGGHSGRVVIEEQRIVLVGDDGRATPFTVEEGRLVGESVTLTSLGDQR